MHPTLKSRRCYHRNAATRLHSLYWGPRDSTQTHPKPQPRWRRQTGRITLPAAQDLPPPPPRPPAPYPSPFCPHQPRSAAAREGLALGLMASLPPAAPPSRRGPGEPGGLRAPVPGMGGTGPFGPARSGRRAGSGAPPPPTHQQPGGGASSPSAIAVGVPCRPARPYSAPGCRDCLPSPPAASPAVAK